MKKTVKTIGWVRLPPACLKTGPQREVAAALGAKVQGFAVEVQHFEGAAAEAGTVATGGVGGTVAGAGAGAAVMMDLTAGGGGDEGQVGDDTVACVEKAHSAVGVGYWYSDLKAHPDSHRADSVGLR